MWVVILLVIATVLFILDALAPAVTAEPTQIKRFNVFLTPVGLAFLAVALILWHAGH